MWRLMFARHKNRTYLLAGQTIPYLRRVAWVDGCVLLDRCAGVDKNKSGTSNDGCPANLPTTTFVLAFCGIILRCVCTLRFPIWNRLLWILYHLNPLPHYHLYHQIQQSTTNYGSFDNSKQCEISPCILTGGFFNATMSRPRYNSAAWADLEKNPDPNRRIIAFMDTILIRSSSWIIPPTMELWKHQHNTLLQYAPTTLFQFQLWCHRGMVD